MWNRTLIESGETTFEKGLHKMRCSRWIILRLLVLVPVLWHVPATATELTEFTGAATRVVWVQDQSRQQNDTLALGQRLRLLKSDGKSEQVLLGEIRNYVKPMLTADGQRVVYSDHQTQKFYAVNWDGKGKKLLGEGLAIEVWRDPKTALDWVYFAKRVGQPEDTTYRNVRRLQIDNPKLIEKVWDKTDVGRDNFQLSADGTRVGGVFPWPNGGIADLTSRTWKKMDQGCWGSLSPDNTGLNWVFDGPHRNLQFHRPDKSEGWKVAVNSAEGIGSHEVFHPRWTNHVQYLVVTGPYAVQGPVNVISGGGPAVEVYLGRFSPDFLAVEAWHKVTSNTLADFYPDVWIDGGEQSRVQIPGLVVSPPNPATVSSQPDWPVAQQGLLAVWDNAKVGRVIKNRAGQTLPACELNVHGAAYFDRHYAVKFAGGTATLDGVQEALNAASRTGSALTLEMLMSPVSLSNRSGTIVELQQLPSASDKRSKSLWAIRQREETLMGTIGEAPPEPLAKLEVTPSPRPVHLLIQVVGEQMDVFLDGRRVSANPNLQSATKPPQASEKSGTGESLKTVLLNLGSLEWRGAIEAIALYSRLLSTEEIQAQAAASRARVMSRKTVPGIKATIQRVEANVIPPPSQILPYRRALSLEVFTIRKLEAGDPKIKVRVGDKIMVGRWVILDGIVLPEPPKATGQTFSVTLEPMADHPELDGERQIQDSAELDLPTFYTEDLIVPPSSRAQ